MVKARGSMIEMKANVRRKRLWVALLVTFWLAVGLAIPFLVSFQGEEIRIDDIAVVAAPRDTYDVVAPIAIDPMARTSVTAGRLALGSAKGQMLTAEASADLIQSGEAMLVLDRGEVVLGDVVTSVAPVAFAGGGDGDAPLVAALKSGSFKALAIRNGTIVVSLPGGHLERFKQAKVQLVPDGAGAVSVKGEGFWRGQRSKFVLRSERPDAEGRLPVTFKLQASLIDVNFEGRLDRSATPSLTGAATLAIKNVERLVNALGQSWPIGRLVQTLSIKGPVRWQSETLAFDKAAVTIDGNEARGTLGLKVVADGEGVLTGTLAFDTLDVGAYLPRGSVMRDRRALQWWRQLADSLSGQSTPPVDADIRVSADKVVSGDQEFGAAAATISMKDGRLAADVAEINLLEGRATGQFSVDFNRFIPAIRARGRLDGIRAGKWLQSVTGVPVVDGVARVKADLVSHGIDPMRIAAELRGRFDFQMEKGATIALALDEIRAGVTSDEPQPVADILDRAWSGTTRLQSFSGVAVVSDGVAHLRTSLADHPKGKAQLAGRIDLIGKGYDLRLLTTDGGGPAVKVSKSAIAQPAAAGSGVREKRRGIERRPPEILKARLLKLRREAYDPSARVSLHPLVGRLEGLQRHLEISADTMGRDGF
jgi:AsmA protein